MLEIITKHESLHLSWHCLVVELTINIKLIASNFCDTSRAKLKETFTVLDSRKLKLHCSTCFEWQIPFRRECHLLANTFESAFNNHVKSLVISFIFVDTGVTTHRFWARGHHTIFILFSYYNAVSFGATGINS